jgi:hypothetical protein
LKIPNMKRAGGVAQGIRPWVQSPLPHAHTHTHTQKLRFDLKSHSVWKIFSIFGGRNHLRSEEIKDKLFPVPNFLESMYDHKICRDGVIKCSTGVDHKYFGIKTPLQS